MELSTVSESASAIASVQCGIHGKEKKKVDVDVKSSRARGLFRGRREGNRIQETTGKREGKGKERRGRKREGKG